MRSFFHGFVEMGMIPDKDERKEDQARRIKIPTEICLVFERRNWE
jgi:hypothetical protein